MMMIDITAKPCIVCTSFRSESSKVALFQVRIPDAHDVVSYVILPLKIFALFISSGAYSSAGDSSRPRFVVGFVLPFPC